MWCTYPFWPDEPSLGGQFGGHPHDRSHRAPGQFGLSPRYQLAYAIVAFGNEIDTVTHESARWPDRDTPVGQPGPTNWS
ncbi:hypothetical protein FAIPA1_10055 [Frankia sp. AiPs1]